MSFPGKTVIVTGGTGGLGSAVATRFLSEGASVVVSYRQERELRIFAGATGERFLSVQADVTTQTDVEKLFDSAIAKTGAIDILVNTVGGYLPAKSLNEISEQEWDRMMSINLKSTFLCTREALKRMKGQWYGRIINLSALAGLKPVAGKSAYAIAKSGVSLLTQIVAEEQRGTGITINAIAPDIIDTVANREAMSQEDFTQWVRTEHIADMITYLCSEAAVSISGTTLRVAGGMRSSQTHLR
jgi:NAD(P)-dependent dehydrogenase (short-subunit alcohol dehydrogenase family)